MMTVVLRFLALVFLVGALEATAWAQIDFEGRREIPAVSSGSTSIFSGDFDEDGVVDLVSLESTLAFYRGSGDQLFDGIPLHDASASSFAVLGDVNGDGRPDVVSTSGPGGDDAGFQVFLGSGPGEIFQTPIFSAYGCGGYRPCLGDFDEDGILDAVVAGHDEAHFCLYFGDGSGAFPSHVEVATPGESYRPIPVDIDLDGHLDIVLSRPSTFGIDIHRGHGDGTFYPPAGYPLTSSPERVLASDVNLDGWPDLVLSLSGGLRVVVNDGVDGLTSGPLLSSSFTSIRHLVDADLNGDSWPDLLALGRDPDAGSYDLIWFLSDGNGGFLPLRSERSPNRARTLTCADFDGDGNLDVAVPGDGNEVIALLPGDGMGGLGPFHDYVPALRPGFPRSGSDFGDWNEDGLFDLILTTNVVNSAGEVRLFVGTGEGLFRESSAIPTPPGLTGAYAVVGGDFNRDGHLDAAFAREMWFLAYGSGAGDFTVGQEMAGQVADDVAVGDLDKDGWLDLVLAVADLDEIHVYFSDGSGGLRIDPLVLGGVDVRRLRVVDVDGDGSLDIGASWFSTEVFFGDGQGGFPVQVTIPHTVNSPRALTFSDFDGDGLLDVAVAGDAPGGRGRLSVLRNVDGRTFAMTENHAVRSSPTLVESLDADGEGSVDLALGAENSVTLLRGAGDGTFGLLPYSFGIGRDESYRMCVGDLNSDGRPDIALPTRLSRDISILYNRSPQYPSAADRVLLGQVNAGRGTLANVLFVNGSSGDATRTVASSLTEPLEFDMEKPPSRQSRPAARFALYAWWRRTPSDESVIDLPFGSGLLSFPIPAVGGGPQPKVTWNNFRHFSALGMPDMPSDPAPSTPLSLSPGPGFPVHFTLQGIIADDGAVGQFDASPTNGIIVRVE